MAVVKRVRRAARAAGGVLDAEDRQVLGQLLVLVGGGGTVILAAAGVLGLAWRLLHFAAG